MSINQQHPVIIVGAGLAGLNCARLLVQRNVPVMLLEAAAAVGGRVQYAMTSGVVGVRTSTRKIRGAAVILATDGGTAHRSAILRRQEHRG